MKLHLQSRADGGAVITLDSADSNASPLCFCGDCFEPSVVDSGSANAAQPPPSARMRRILSHVTPASNIPRDLLSEEVGEIPWCRDVSAGAPVPVSTGYHSPPCTFRPFSAAVSSGGGSPAPGARSSADTSKAAAVNAIDELAPALDDIALELWAHPELNYEETFAHGYITDFIESQGVDVERGYLGCARSQARALANRQSPILTSH